ncbi:hypothetical protein GCM10007242_05180 [Pigmentiphaga litoralis]|nr:hypothetical protein GCM10007242_05180 [Pigmentiphaga litoralis]
MARERGDQPDAPLKDRFLDSLHHLITEALHPQAGDVAFQAMVLRHGNARVREFASLQAHAEKDKRRVRSSVDAIAHPGKLQRREPDALRDMLMRVHTQASSGAWTDVGKTCHCMLTRPETQRDSDLERSLRNLLAAPALERLQRLSTLADDASVRQYLALWESHGPASGSAEAAAQGAGAQERGAAVEALAAHALDALARHLGRVDGKRWTYRVVTAMHVPAVLVDSAQRAKTEWDAVVLRQPNTEGDVAQPWDVCLLVEAKASADAATTDFPRLLRGLRLLSLADPDVVYRFVAKQGTVDIRGASLNALPTTDTAETFQDTVLYCSDAPADQAPRPLSAASRMQLLSSTTTLDYASKLKRDDMKHDDTADGTARISELEPVWQALLNDPRWLSVLNQYATLRRVRELMVHIADLQVLFEE